MLGRPARDLLRTLTPFVVAPARHLPMLDLAPFGLKIPRALVLDPQRLRSSPWLERLETLDALTFGPRGMAMPRWVFYDCSEMPSAIVGLAARGSALLDEYRHPFRLSDPRREWVPVSIHILVPTLEPGVFFEHNLGSIGRGLAPRGRAGVGTLTKAIGARVYRAREIVGAAQWDSPATAVHVKFGPVRLETAYTPAHTYAASFTYRHPTDTATLERVLAGDDAPLPRRTRWVAADDDRALRSLQGMIERGRAIELAGPPVQRRGRRTVPVHVGDRQAR